MAGRVHQLCENLRIKLTSIDNDMQRRALSQILIGPGAANVKGELSRPSFSRPTAQIVNRLPQLRRGNEHGGIHRRDGGGVGKRADDPLDCATGSIKRTTAAARRRIR